MGTDVAARWPGRPNRLPVFPVVVGTVAVFVAASAVNPAVPATAADLSRYAWSAAVDAVTAAPDLIRDLVNGEPGFPDRS